MRAKVRAGLLIAVATQAAPAHAQQAQARMAQAQPAGAVTTEHYYRIKWGRGGEFTLLFPDKARFDADEARRFSLLEEHWDVVVTSADE